MGRTRKLKPISGGQNPCLNCPPISLDMRCPIAVGFGDAHVSRDGKVIWSESPNADARVWTVRTAERRAARDPRHDWRIVLNGPLHGETYQRQGVKRWVLVARNLGFA